MTGWLADCRLPFGNHCHFSSGEFSIACNELIHPVNYLRVSKHTHARTLIHTLSCAYELTTHRHSAPKIFPVNLTRLFSYIAVMCVCVWVWANVGFDCSGDYSVKKRFIPRIGNNNKRSVFRLMGINGRDASCCVCVLCSLCFRVYYVPSIHL